MKTELIKYAEGMEAKPDVLTWLETHVFTQEHIDQGEVEHVIDFLVSDKAPKRLNKASYEQMKVATEKWTKALAKKGEHIQEGEGDTETVLDFKDGFKVVKLIGKPAFEREGFLMRHCVAQYFGKDDEVYSLRDRDNMPHATLSKSSQQIRGKGNGAIHPKYIKYVVGVLEFLEIEVRDGEMLNLGYMNLGKFKKYLHEDVQKTLFKKKYWYRENKILDKEGNEFACLEFLDQIPLIQETQTSLKMNFELPTFIKCSIDFLFRSIKKIASGDYTQNASSGRYTQNASSGRYTQNASSGDYTKNASSGDYTQNEMLGQHSISVDAGHQGQARGKKGCWFCLSEWKKATDGLWKPCHVEAFYIDGKKIKEDTWYTLENKKLVEAKKA